MISHENTKCFESCFFFSQTAKFVTSQNMILQNIFATLQYKTEDVPNISLSSVTFTIDYFGSHPVRGTNNRLQSSYTTNCLKSFRRSKVSQLHISFTITQNIGSWKIKLGFTLLNETQIVRSDCCLTPWRFFSYMMMINHNISMI